MTSQDFSMYAGDSRTLTVTVTDQNNNPVNLTNSTIKWVLINGNAVIKAKDNQAIGGITITNATSGQFSITISAQDTAKLQAGTYQHEARLIDSNGNSAIIFTGNVTIIPSYV
jgi:iron uptake system EfeUOB component EfeO/EfeM